MLRRFLNWFGEGDDTSFARIPLEVKGRLYVTPMPYGPYDVHNRAMASIRRYNITHIVILLTEEEIRKKGKKNLKELYDQMRITYDHLPAGDLTSPVGDLYLNAMPGIIKRLAHDRIAIHCNAGVGRTGVFAACLVAAFRNCNGDDALTYVKQHMQTDLTDEQKRFVRRWVSDIDPALIKRALADETEVSADETDEVN